MGWFLAGMTVGFLLGGLCGISKQAEMDASLREKQWIIDGLMKNRSEK